MVSRVWCLLFCTDRAPTELYTLSLHDALPISVPAKAGPSFMRDLPGETPSSARRESEVSEGSAPAAISAPYAGADRKSTRLNSSHVESSYAVFCLKKKKKQREP